MFKRLEFFVDCKIHESYTDRKESLTLPPFLASPLPLCLVTDELDRDQSHVVSHTSVPQNHSCNDDWLIDLPQQFESSTIIQFPVPSHRVLPSASPPQLFGREHCLHVLQAHYLCGSLGCRRKNRCNEDPDRLLDRAVATPVPKSRFEKRVQHSKAACCMGCLTLHRHRRPMTSSSRRCRHCR